MGKVWPWVVAAAGVAALIIDFYAFGAEVGFIEEISVANGIDHGALTALGFLGLALFVGGLILGIYRIAKPARHGSNSD